MTFGSGKSAISLATAVSILPEGIWLFGKRKTGRRVFDRRILDAYPCAGCRTEVADALVVERHGGDAAYALRDARALVIEEVEQLVLLDRAADAAAELILVILRTAQVVAVGEEVIGIEIIVAEVLEQQAVHLVGPALRIHGNNGAGTAAVFSRVRIGDDVEFLDHVDRGMRCLRAQFLHVLREGVVVDAVEDEVVLQRVHAIDVEVARAPGGGVAALLGVSADLDSGHGAQEVVPVAQVERRLLDGLQAHNGADGGIIRRQQTGVCLHLDGLLRGSDLEMKVLAPLFTDVEDDIILHGSEAGLFHLYGVLADGHGLEGIEPRRIGRQIADVACLLVGCCHFRAASAAPEASVTKPLRLAVLT